MGTSTSTSVVHQVCACKPAGEYIVSILDQLSSHLGSRCAAFLRTSIIPAVFYHTYHLIAVHNDRLQSLSLRKVLVDSRIVRAANPHHLIPCTWLASCDNLHIPDNIQPISSVAKAAMARYDAASSGIARTESTGRVLTSIRGWFAVFAAAILALAACRATAMVVMQHKAGTRPAGADPSPPPAAALASTSSNASDVLHCHDTRGSSTIGPISAASRLSQKTVMPAVLRAQPNAAAAAAGPGANGRLLLQAQPVSGPGPLRPCLSELHVKVRS